MLQFTVEPEFICPTLCEIIHARSGEYRFAINMEVLEGPYSGLHIADWFGWDDDYFGFDQFHEATQTNNYTPAEAYIGRRVCIAGRPHPYIYNPVDWKERYA